MTPYKGSLVLRFLSRQRPSRASLLAGLFRRRPSRATVLAGLAPAVALGSQSPGSGRIRVRALIPRACVEKRGRVHRTVSTPTPLR
jgi:hypothetical protein